ncbi:MAG: AAA family ATPase [Deltaproteobacteria bacterium]|nr:AAA family ATPase [Deltaproteobacteria bacterium]
MSASEELAALAALWRRERDAVRARFAEERRGLPLSERVARGLALTDLEIDETDVAPGGRLLCWLVTRRPGGLGHLRIGPGDPVRLWWDDPDGSEAVRATVARRRGDRLAIIVDDALPERFDDPGFRLDVDAPETTFVRGERAIERMATAKAGTDTARLREVVYGEDPTISEAALERPHLDEELDPSQRAAVVASLAAYPLALIWGPPGTGKTRTLVEAIRQAVAGGERVLATAASNTAVDNLAERLADAGVDVVRLGHPARVSEAVMPRTLDALLEATEAWRLTRRWVSEAAQLRHTIQARSGRGTLSREERRALSQEAWRLGRDAREQLRAAEAAILDHAEVICATAAGADGALLAGRQFDLVALDEATQAPDPIALVALCHGKRAILAGDPCQLPPTVIDPAVAREGLGVTLFERLQGRLGEGAASLLTVQRRMPVELMSFPSAALYQGRLTADPSVAGQRLEDLAHVAADPLRPGPLCFIDTAGKGFEERRGDDDPSVSNPGQAERTAREVRRLLGRGVRAADLALITPYDAQARALRGLLGDAVGQGLEVGTVDGFQGREKDVVVVDLVRSNEDGELGFLRDVRRMNVALTRARRLLLVVGDSATLGRHPFYAAFLEAAEAQGAWMSAWSDEAEPFAG